MLFRSALLEYRRGLREDPTDPLKLKKDCKYAVKLIKKEYAELQRVAADIVNMINLRYHEIPEENKAEVDEKTFQLLLGFHQSIRPPRIDNIILGFPKEDIFLGFGITMRSSQEKSRKRQNDFWKKHIRLQIGKAFWRVSATIRICNLI